MSWEIRIPFEDRSDPVGFVGFAARELEDANERAIVDEMVLEAIDVGIETAGQLVDSIERRPPEERRVLLDRWRERAGLPTATEVERQRADAKFERELDRLQPPPPPRWSPLQRCPVCGAYPMEGSGAWKRVSVERWHCPAHEHLAAEGDLEEHEPPIIGVSGTMAPIYSEKERRRRAEWVKQHDEKEQRERRRQKEHQEREAEALDAVRERYREQGEVSVLGIRCRPDGRIIQ